MKKILFLFTIVLLAFTQKSQAQCEYQIISITGNTVNFQHMWPIVGINTIDSVYFDYGDATSQMFYAGPPPGGIPGTSSHTYPGPGTYITCLTRYMSSLGNPGVPIICTWCDTIVIPPTSTGPCSFFAFPNGLEIAFFPQNTNPNLILDSVKYDYGNGTVIMDNSGNPFNIYMYTLPGTYYVCTEQYWSDPVLGPLAPCTFCDSVSAFPLGCSVTAGFTNVVAGQTVNFTSTSTITGGTIVFYEWDFDDGNFSNAPNPTHTYASPGVYNVCLYVEGEDANGNICDDFICFPITVTASATCVANASFGASGTGLTKTFLNTSTCAGCTNSWLWNFGDGNTSTSFSPVHTYALGGTYLVCLLMNSTGPNGGTCADTFCVNVVATAPNCIANSIFTSSTSGLTASFNNTSTCNSCTSVSRVWQFGDGNLSTVASPSHTYAAAGTYNVCLITTGVYNNGASTCVDTTCMNVSVAPAGACVSNAAFSYTTNLLAATFNNLSNCSFCTTTTYQWSFGDGNTSTAANPTHTYAFSGVYNACLITTGVSANGTVCKDTFCTAVNVTLPIGCTADAIFTGLPAGNTVSFLNSSTCTSCTSALYDWNFGDGNTSTWNSPTHTYLTVGTFNACLKVTGYATNQTICKDSVCKQIVINSLGVDDFSKKSLSIYPNPTSNEVKVALPTYEKLIRLEMYDVTGRMIKSIDLDKVNTSELVVDLSNYTSGSYFFTLRTENWRYQGQVVKQ
jgi:PKD repeat protein